MFDLKQPRHTSTLPITSETSRAGCRPVSGIRQNLMQMNSLTAGWRRLVHDPAGRAMIRLRKAPFDHRRESISHNEETGECAT
jgi:hypothetical protein